MIIKIKKILRILRHLSKTNHGKANFIIIYKNFLVLQIKKNLSKKPFIFKTCSKSFAFVQQGINSDSISGLFYYGLNEFNEVLFAWHILRPNDIFFDIGANQGSWGLILCPKKIVCHEFEPSKDTYEVLQKQILLNKKFQSYLVPHKEAIFNKNGTIEFTIGRFTCNQIKANNIKNKNIKFEKVRSITLNSASEKYGNPTLIKIDVEGFNQEVLEKGNKVLANPSLKALIIETFRSEEVKKKSFKEFEKLLASYGFYPYSYNPIRRTIKPITKRNEGSKNDTIYFRVKRDDLILLKESIPLKVLGKYY